MGQCSRSHNDLVSLNGKFADLVPNDETGDPDFTIHSLSELAQDSGSVSLVFITLRY